MPTLFEKLNEKNAKKLRSKTKNVEVSKVPMKKQKNPRPKSFQKLEKKAK